MSFETGGDMQDPFHEEESEDHASDTSGESQAESETPARSPEFDSATEEQSADDSSEKSNHKVPQSENIQTDTSNGGQPAEQGVEIPYVKDLDITHPVSTTQLARALMVPAYHEENPPVPYSVWRDGTSTGRSRTTIELNSDVDELVKQSLREFNNRYDADIHKADVRELALAYGLAHLDEVFAMAEEWGIQYNS